MIYLHGKELGSRVSSIAYALFPYNSHIPNFATAVSIGVDQSVFIEPWKKSRVVFN